MIGILPYPEIKFYNHTTSNLNDVAIHIDYPDKVYEIKKIKRNNDKSCVFLNYSKENPATITITFSDDDGIITTLTIMKDVVLTSSHCLKATISKSTDDKSYEVRVTDY